MTLLLVKGLFINEKGDVIIPLFLKIFLCLLLILLLIARIIIIII